MAIVEPVHGQIKAVRGLRRFLLRCMEQVDGKWQIIAAKHNLLQLFRHVQLQEQTLALASL